jgi:hypothetical protein
MYRRKDEMDNEEAQVDKKTGRDECRSCMDGRWTRERGLGLTLRSDEVLVVRRHEAWNHEGD